MSSIIHCQNMLFLVGLKFNNLTGSVNTPFVWTWSLALCTDQRRSWILVSRMGSICLQSGDAVRPG